MASEKYDPPKMVATPENFDTFLNNQILLYHAMVMARRGTPKEKHPDTERLTSLMKELENLRWKAKHIFVSSGT